MSDQTKEPTVEEMKAALREAAVKIKNTATDEEVWLAYEEMKAATEPGPEPVKEPVAATAPANGKKDSLGSLDEVLARAHPQMGDKDPVVIAWCRDNLSEDDFNERYAGRKFDRE
jgi:hypothetical protein